VIPQEGVVMSTTEKALSVLSNIAETDEVLQDLDMPLYELQILDSLKTVELIVAMSSEFGIEIAPSEVEREEWATPRKIVTFIQERVGE
jgi:D-alanine--poly(phosphoribitol) ligase subunit 2